MNTFGKDRMAQILIQSLKIVNNSITGKYNPPEIIQNQICNNAALEQGYT